MSSSSLSPPSERRRRDRGGRGLSCDAAHAEYGQRRTWYASSMRRSFSLRSTVSSRTYGIPRARWGEAAPRRCSRTLRTLRYLIIPVQIRALRLTNAWRSCCLLLSSILPPCDGEARLRELIVCQALSRLRHGQFPRLWSWRLRQPRRRGERLLEAGRIQPGTGSSVQRQGNFFSPSGVAFVTGTRNAS